MENHLKTGGELLKPVGVENMVANMEMNEECRQVFQELKIRKKHRYIVYKMGIDFFEIESLGAKSEVIFLIPAN